MPLHGETDREIKIPGRTMKVEVALSNRDFVRANISFSAAYRKKTIDRETNSTLDRAS